MSKNDNFKRISGVASHLWTEEKFDQEAYTDKERAMAYHAVKIGTAYYFKHLKSGAAGWYKVNGGERDAQKEAYNIWFPNKQKSAMVAAIQNKAAYNLNTTLYNPISSTSETIESEDVKTFFTGKKSIPYQNPDPKKQPIVVMKDDFNTNPTLQGMMTIPMGTQFVIYKENTFLNEWVDSIVEGDDTHINYGKVILRLIYRNLCDGQCLNKNASIEGEMLYQQVLTNKYTNPDFKFIMNWLACLIQRPGYNMQTNLWLVGRLQGIGKGTLFQIMKAIIGQKFTGSLNQKQIEKDWTSGLANKILIEADEFDGRRTRELDWDRWIKENTTNDEIEIVKKGVDGCPMLNIANYYFTSNSENPIDISVDDRRNQFIKTTQDKSAIGFARSIQNIMKTKLPEIAMGLAFIFEKVQFDESLVAYAQMNSIKRKIIEENMQSNDPACKVEQWINQDIILQRGIAYTPESAHNRFINWHNSVWPKDTSYDSQQTFWTKLGEMSLRNHEGSGVDKVKTPKGFAYFFTQPTNNLLSTAAAIEQGIADLENMLSVDMSDEVDRLDDDPTLVKKITDFSTIHPLERIRAQIRENFMNDNNYINGDE